jgi:hypothetical protein
MLPRAMSPPKRVLMTLDAVGGQWRYSVDLASALAATGVECVLAGLGPEPNPAQQREVHALRNVALTWTRHPLDWTVQDASALDEIGDTLLTLGREWDVNLLHLNLPSQAAMVARDVPVAVTSHSCIRPVRLNGTVCCHNGFPNVISVGWKPTDPTPNRRR